MPAMPPPGFRRRVTVVLSATALGAFVSAWKATALAIAELGIGAFFVAGLVRAEVGSWTPWAVLAAALLGALVRAIDLESWGLLMPGGLAGRAEAAFGPAASAMTSATVLVERVLLAGTAAVGIGEYGSGFLSDVVVGWPAAARLPPTDPSTVIAIGAIGVVWVRGRLGRDLSSSRLARAAWAGVVVLVATAAWAIRSAPGGAIAALPPLAPGALLAAGPEPVLMALTVALIGIGLALPAVGGGNAVTRSAHEFAPPRVPTLRRTTIVAALVVTLLQVSVAWAFIALVPENDARVWMAAPVAGIADRLAGPSWLVHAWMFLVVAAAVTFAVPAAQAALLDVDQVLRRLARLQLVPDALLATDRWMGTATRAGDAATLSAILVVVAARGRVVWLGRAGAGAVAPSLAAKAILPLPLPTLRPAPRAFPPAAPRGGPGPPP